jgi:hypothetical protein
MAFLRLYAAGLGEWLPVPAITRQPALHFSAQLL